MDTNLTNTNFLTQNNVDDYSSQISGQNIVWLGIDGNDSEIYLYDHDNASVIQLTDNDAYENSPRIDGTSVVWSAYDGNDYEIYLYDGSDTIQLTDNDVDDNNPQISDGNVAWLSYEGEPNYHYYPNSALYFYDGTSTTKLTDANTVINQFDLSGNQLAWSYFDGKDSEIFVYDGTGITQLTANSLSENSPRIDNGQIVWSAYDDNDSEIFYYDGSEVIQLTDNDTYDSSPEISGNNIVWLGSDDDYNSEIYLFNGLETIQVTDNDSYEYSIQVSGDNIVWSAYDGNDEEIFVYDGSTIIQLTDNDTYDSDPQIDGNHITWTSYEENNDREIYLNYEPNLDPSEINGYKWHDVNQNGIFDSSETGIEGWTIFLDSNENGQLDEGELSTVTDSDGFYSFTDLRFGIYNVAEQQEPRWQQTHPSAIEYEWQDSNQPNGIIYDWVDISGVGTELTLGDDEAANVALPFNFDFYGKAYQTVNISSNGYLTFDDNGTEYYNSGITQSYGVDNFIAPFWDDLNPGYSGSIYHHYDAANDRFIVQYQDIARYEVEPSLTFQVILNADGSIVYQYDNLDAAVNSATVGLEDGTGNAGLQIVHNNNNELNPYLEDGLAIAFTPINSSDQVNSHEIFVGTGETISELNFGNSLEAIRVETEDYEDYYDSTPGNTGGEYRNDDVDLGLSGDVGGGYTVGWTDAGEWLTYNVEVPEDGTYELIARVASNLDADHSFDVTIDGQVTTVDFGITGGWQAWEDISGGNVDLTAGSHELRIDLGNSGFNLNYLDFAIPETIRIEAEDYQSDYYTSDYTYYDSDYENQGGGYRNNSVDIEPTSDIGGGFNVGWIESGEYLTYSVDIPRDGYYQVVGRMASDIDADHSMDISIDGELTTLYFGDTGGWQAWEDVLGDELYLTEGLHEVRFDMNSSGFNVNYVDLI